MELVEGSDLVVLDDDCVYARTIDGLQQVDVIYRRVDDLFLDPEVFLPDSMLGVPGLMRAWRSGRVALVNAPGAGIADDKKVYSYVPDIIRFFLDEEPILATVATLRCADEDSRHFVLGNLAKLVVKPANESGGNGVLVGTQATVAELDDVAEQIEAAPTRWVAQPVIPLSTAPTLCDGEIAPRHVDLRPFTLFGPEGAYVTRGGLTRVARKAGSLVVNSSQGGGSKDTWVVDTVDTSARVDRVRPPGGPPDGPGWTGRPGRTGQHILDEPGWPGQVPPGSRHSRSAPRAGRDAAQATADDDDPRHDRSSRARGPAEPNRGGHDAAGTNG